mmetsp:Transcript_24361/g.35177  ORF Transcript_24361/g.35177 Transcript_24361/m.35177 type:complete len:87 (-) Transcript_24361:155-415(-)
MNVSAKLGAIYDSAKSIGERVKMLQDDGRHRGAGGAFGYQSITLFYALRRDFGPVRRSVQPPQAELPNIIRLCFIKRRQGNPIISR